MVAVIEDPYGWYEDGVLEKELESLETRACVANATIVDDVFRQSDAQLTREKLRRLAITVIRLVQDDAHWQRRRSQWMRLLLGGALLSLLVAGVLPVLAWNLSALWLLAFEAVQVLSLLLVLMTVLCLYWLWPNTRRARIGAASSVIGVGAGVYVLVAPYPGVLPSIAAAALLPGLSIAIVRFAAAVLRAFRRPDPYAVLITTLAAALGVAVTCRPSSDDTTESFYEEAVRHRDTQRGLARCLEKAATQIESSLGRSLGATGTEALSAITGQGRRLAAWLRTLEAEVLMQSPGNLAEFEGKVARGLVAACQGDWTALEEEPVDSKSRSWARAWLPRFATAGVLIAATLLVPSALGLDADQTDGHRISLVLAALAALLAPREGTLDELPDLRSFAGPGKGR